MEFYHSGIRGMKWGIRRWQNPDGSLTEAGKKRYGVGVPGEGGHNRLNRKEREALAKQVSKGVNTPYKQVASLSDEELQKAINRMQNEDRYLQLMKTRYPEVKEPDSKTKILIEKGKAMADKALEQAGQEQLNRLTKYYIGKTVDSIIPGINSDAIKKITDVHSRPGDVTKITDSDLKKYLERVKNEQKYKKRNGGLGDDDDDD